MERVKAMKQSKEQLLKRFLPVVALFTIAAFALAACSGPVQGNSPIQAPVIEPTPIVRATNTVILPLPTATAILTPYPSPTPTIIEQPKTVVPAIDAVSLKSDETKPKLMCKYYSGSSSFDRLGKYLEERHDGAKSKDESRNYSVITMKEKGGNMVVFITKSGAMINFINEVLFNEEISKVLPCDPKQVTEIHVLIGGNDEKNVSIPVTTISKGIADIGRRAPIMYTNADVIIDLPYITPDDNEIIWKRRNDVDSNVMDELQNVKRVTVIPLSRYVVSGKSLIGNFQDPLHMDPEFLLGLLGGKQTIFSFSKN